MKPHVVPWIIVVENDLHFFLGILQNKISVRSHNYYNFEAVFQDFTTISMWDEICVIQLDDPIRGAANPAVMYGLHSINEGNAAFYEFSRPEYWSGQPFPSPGDLPSPGFKPRSPKLQVDSLPAEPQGKPSWKPVNIKNFVFVFFLMFTGFQLKYSISFVN